MSHYPQHGSTDFDEFNNRAAEDARRRAQEAVERQQVLERTQSGTSTVSRPSSTPFVPSDLLENFRFAFETNKPGNEFFDNGKRRRKPTFDEMRERFGRGQIGQFEAIAAGTGFWRATRDPVSGQLIGNTDPKTGLYRGPAEKVPSFNIDISQIRNSLNQQAGAQRQNLAAAAGNRRDPRFGGAQTAAINQSFGASFGAQTAANTNLISDVQRANIQTRLFGVQGQQDVLAGFRKEAGLRADIGLRQDSLRLGREGLRVGKEGQDLRAALEKKRLGILGFTAGEQAAFNREQMRLAWAELKEKIEQGFYGGGNTSAIDWARVAVDFLDAVT